MIRFNTFSAFLRSIFSVLFVSSLFLACEGPQGPPGRDGNWNVLSIRYEVLEQDWIPRGTEGQPGYFLELEFNVPEITNLIVQDGLVLVYYRQRSNDPWLLLPYTFISSDDPPYTEVLDFIYGPQFVNFKSQADDFGATPYVGTFRVIIADGIPVGKEAIDYRDFELVSALLNLDEAKEIYRAAGIN